MKQYVLGFIFNHLLDHVVLIEKARPKWQAGLLGGIGGKIEGNEMPIEAMQRESGEETGLRELTWKRYGMLKCFSSIADTSNDWCVSLFTAMAPPDVVPSREHPWSFPELVNSDPTEPVHWYDITELFGFRLIGNVQMLVWAARDQLANMKSFEDIVITYAPEATDSTGSKP